MQRFINSYSLGSQVYVSFRVITENDQNVLEIVGTSGKETATVTMRISEKDLSKMWFRMTNCPFDRGTTRGEGGGYFNACMLACDQKKKKKK